MSQLRDANIIWLLSLLLLLLAIPHGQSDRSFNAYQLNQNTTAYIPLGQDPVVTPNLESILLTYEPTQTTSFGPGYESFVQQIVKWLSPSNIVSTIPSVDGGNYDDENKYGTRISTYEECKRFYGCLYYILLRSAAQDPEPSDDPSEPDVDLRVCVSELFNKTLACEIYISDVRYLAQDSCASRINTIDAERRWQMEAVDENLQVFMESGGDSRGIWWQGLKPVGEDYGNQPSFSSELGRQMIGDTSFQCSLASPCLPNLDCHTVGSHIAYALGKKPLAETWALYALTALKNINQQLSSQYIALKGVTIGPTLRTFSIKDFYPQPDKDFNLPNILRSLASAFALLGGFTPGVAGKALSQGSTTIGAVGAYLGRYIGDSAGTTIVQEQYADYVEQIYTSLMSGLDDVTAKLFNGSAIDGDFNILSMVRGGAWLDTSALQRASGLEDKLRIEILSRSINAVWKTPTSNKIFVTFVDLGDGVNSTTICKADTTGPAELKYCGDGGVYYLYNIIEDGEGVAHLSWPWGADKIWDKLKINPAWITEASARTYRTAKSDPNLDPFNFSEIDGTAAFLNQTLSKDPSININDLVGRYPGTWTVPVCDTGTWGGSWNWNFISNGTVKDIQLMPCLCGQGGLETAPWVNASGMLGFQTYYQTCKGLLTDKVYGFQWPQGVANVNFGFGDVIVRPND